MVKFLILATIAATTTLAGHYFAEIAGVTFPDIFTEVVFFLSVYLIGALVGLISSLE